MEIALLNVPVIFQKNEVTVDDIGNHTSKWSDYYRCHATVSGEGGTETAVAGITVDDSDLSFTVRYCKKTSLVDVTGYRIVFQEELYNILAIDHMNYKRKSIKFKCQKVRR